MQGTKAYSKCDKQGIKAYEALLCVKSYTHRFYIPVFILGIFCLTFSRIIESAIHILIEQILYERMSCEFIFSRINCILLTLCNKMALLKYRLSFCKVKLAFVVFKEKSIYSLLSVSIKSLSYCSHYMLFGAIIMLSGFILLKCLLIKSCVSKRLAFVTRKCCIL